MKNIITLSFLLSLMFNVQAQTLKVGDKAPEIIQNSVTGEEFKLSSLKGQMVLIDFWASWCAPCRKETPYLIKAYQKYKDADFKNAKKFTIVSVSFDSKKDAWVKAIEMDKMVWPYHVSDLNGWLNALAKIYSIKSLPTNYLIDADGVIVAMNLRGEAVDKKLKKLKKGIF